MKERERLGFVLFVLVKCHAPRDVSNLRNRFVVPKRD
jgi:hypothetical protein